MKVNEKSYKTYPNVLQPTINFLDLVLPLKITKTTIHTLFIQNTFLILFGYINKFNYLYSNKQVRYANRLNIYE